MCVSYAIISSVHNALSAYSYRSIPSWREVLFVIVVGVFSVGGVAQLLGRRSLAGGLSLIYAQSVVDM